MVRKIPLAIVAMSIPSITFAQGAEKFECTLGELTRRVEILYETADAVPCEVHYYKNIEAPEQRQVLWSAGSQSGYCEEKSTAFIEKLEGWGWDCASASVRESDVDVDAATADEEVVEVDDTAALEPASTDN